LTTASLLTITASNFGEVDPERHHWASLDGEQWLPVSDGYFCGASRYRFLFLIATSLLLCAEVNVVAPIASTRVPC
jgi:hypothetical protein